MLKHCLCRIGKAEPGEVCTSEIDFKDASEVCDKLEHSPSQSKLFR